MSARQCGIIQLITISKNIYYVLEYRPSGRKRDTRAPELGISIVSSSLELRRHKLVCQSTPFFTANPVAKLMNHILTHIHPTISGSRSYVSRTSPDVSRGCPRRKILLLLAADGVIIPIFAIFIKPFLKQGRP